MHKFYYILISLTLFLCGCGSKQPLDVDFQHHEARFSDIPIPFNVTPIRNSISEHSCGYILQEPQQASADFYKREMERMGWQLMGQFSGFETELLFSKLNRICTVSIRPFMHNKKPNVRIFIKQMKQL